MRSLKQVSGLALLGASLVVVALYGMGCGGDDPVGPDIDPAPTGSNLSFDRLGVAVAPGSMSIVNVTPLAGELEDFSVESSDETVATASASATPKAGGSAAAGVIAVSGVGAGTATITVTTASGDEREFPVTVYDPMVLDTGEMLIKIVDKFEYRWNDKGSGASAGVGTFHPVAPAGYHAVGSISHITYAHDIDGTAWAIVVKDKGTNPDHPPFVAPESYEAIITVPDWNQPFGIPAVTAWRPVPPTNLPDEYVAVGTVVGGDGTSGAVCIRKDLTDYAASTLQWHDGGSGSALPFVSVWRSDTKPNLDQSIPYGDAEREYLSTGSIIMRENRGNPSQDPNYMEITRVLKVKPQVLIDAVYRGWEPSLTSLEKPPPNSQPIMTKALLVPFTAFDDPSAPNLAWLVANTPFYVLERRQFWNREYWADVGATRGWKTGINDETANASWEEQSIEVTANLGFEFKGISGGVTATVSQTLGFASSRAVSTFEESSTDVDVPAPPAGSKIALWRLRNQFLMWRHGDSGLVQFLAPWTLDELAFHKDTYPN